MTTTLIDVHADRLNKATQTGTPYHLGVTLSFVGRGRDGEDSDKFWAAVLYGDRIAINYGPHGARGAFKLHDNLETREKAAAKMWSLLRDKVGKGYAVTDAALMIVSDGAQTCSRYTPQIAEEVTREWDALRRARRANPDRPMWEPDHRGKSPRTGKQGGQVILAVTSPTADHDALLAAWDSDRTERFLPPIVLSHPNCPDEAKFIAAMQTGDTPDWLS